MIADMRAGRVTSFAWVAIGPDFARWENSYMRGRQDRVNLLGQMAILAHQMIQKELSEE